MLAPPPLIAQAHPAATAQAHNRFGPDPSPMPTEPLVAPLFLQTDQIDSAVTVVNGVMQATSGTLTIRDLDGNIAATKHITYAPHSSTVVQLRQVLAEVGSTIHAGSVLLQQDPALKGPALLAQLSLTLHTGSQSAFLEEEFGMPSAMMSSATLQGIASQTANAPVVAITGTSEVAQTIQTRCLGDPAPHTFELAVGATVLVQACAEASSWHPLRDSDLNSVTALTADSRSTPHSLGLSIHSDGLPGSFYAFGFALNGSTTRPQLQPIDFYDPGEAGSTQTVYTGVPVGPNSTLQPGTYVPVLTLANFSAQPRIVSINHLDSSSTAPGTPAKPEVVQQLTLAPGATRTVELASLPGSGLQHSFTIGSDGKPGDVQAHLFAYRSSSDQRVELLAKNAADQHNGGNHPWSTEHGDTSTLLLFNPTAQQQEFQVRISGGGATWLDLLYLAPFETRAVSINDLIAKETGDHDRRKLPRSLQRGEVQWSTRMPSDGFGRLLVSNPSTGLSRSFSCGEIAAMCLASLGPMAQQDLLDGDQAALFYGVSTSVCVETGPGNCSYNGAITGASLAFNTGWTASSNAQIVSSTNTQVNLKGIAPGFFFYNGSVVSGSCEVPVGGSGMVQPLPHIYYNGTDVTGKTFTAPVGLQLPLTASISLPAGVTATNPIWAIPNGAVGGYTATVQRAYVTSPTTTGTSTTIYWVSPGTYTVSFSTTLNDGFVASAQVTFNAKGPSITSSSTPHTGVSVGGNPLYLGMFGLPVKPGDPYLSGITFNATISSLSGFSMPGFPGSLSFIQVVNSFTAQYYGGAPCSINYGAGLDSGLLPYPTMSGGVTSISTEDSPGIPLHINVPKTEAKAQFNATMFLMWTPSVTPSIPVPLANVAWQWQGDALVTPQLINNLPVWILASSGNSSSATNLIPSTSFPVWNRSMIIPNTLNICP